MTSARQIALGGLFAALATVIMLLGGIIPIALFICPMLASLLLAVLIDRLPKRLCVVWYLAVALLSALLCPDRECAFVFVFLGYYPLVRPALTRLPRVPRIFCKLLLFNTAIAAMYALLIFVFQLQAVIAEAQELTLAFGLVLWLLGNIAFFLYDLLLSRAAILFRRK